VGREEVISAIRNARGGPVDEGAVGAGTGTIAFGFKGGIGTASRRLPASLGGFTIGVLVQTNFGGVLTIAGAPVGRELGRYYLKEELERVTAGKTTGSTGTEEGAGKDLADGSVIIVIATDAPLDSRNLKRMAARAMLGLGRTGSSAGNGSGDYALSFSTAASVRIRSTPNQAAIRQVELLSNDAISPLFLAVVEATEEAVYNSLFRASTTTSRGRTVEALPIGRTLAILRKYGVIPR
jgi:D-aminopeptidase